MYICCLFDGSSSMAEDMGAGMKLWILMVRYAIVAEGMWTNIWNSALSDRLCYVHDQKRKGREWERKRLSASKRCASHNYWSSLKKREYKYMKRLCNRMVGEDWNSGSRSRQPARSWKSYKCVMITVSKPLCKEVRQWSWFEYSLSQVGTETCAGCRLSWRISKILLVVSNFIGKICKVTRSLPTSSVGLW